MIKREVIINKLKLPVDNYHYDVQLLTSIDGGKKYYYAGFGKFAKTMDEAIKVKQELEAKNV
jgi:hypothetical protein